MTASAMDEYIQTDHTSFFRVQRQAYVCNDLWKQELKQIFDRSWLYAGHESELPEPGSFQSRKVGGRPVILARTEQNEIHAFLNACAHRGASVCNEASGKTKRFSCPYHGWSYSTEGKLVGLPGHSAYGGQGQLPDIGLTKLPLQSYRGFLFICAQEPSCSLKDYLGPATQYIDLVCDQSEAQLEVIPNSIQHGLHANWKLLAENGVDAYHLPYTHGRFLNFINALNTEPVSHKRTGIGISLGNGHSVIKSGPPSTGRPIAYWSPLFPETMKPVIRKRYEDLVTKFGQNRADDMALTNRSLFIFPNLVINDILGLNIRTFFPIAPDRVEVSVWGAGFSNESPAERAARIDGLMSFVGPGGLGTPDDIEILESCQRAYAHGSTDYSDFSRGLAQGTEMHTDEEQNRAFWIEWSKRLKGAR